MYRPLCEKDKLLERRINLRATYELLTNNTKSKRVSTCDQLMRSWLVKQPSWEQTSWWPSWRSSWRRSSWRAWGQPSWRSSWGQLSWREQLWLKQMVNIWGHRFSRSLTRTAILVSAPINFRSEISITDRNGNYESLACLSFSVPVKRIPRWLEPRKGKRRTYTFCFFL